MLEKLDFHIILKQNVCGLRDVHHSFYFETPGVLQKLNMIECESTALNFLIPKRVQRIEGYYFITTSV